MRDKSDVREDKGQQSHSRDAQDSAYPIYTLGIPGARDVWWDGDDSKYEEDRGQTTLDVEYHPPKLFGLAEKATWMEGAWHVGQTIRVKGRECIQRQNLCIGGRRGDKAHLRPSRGCIQWIDLLPWPRSRGSW